MSNVSGGKLIRTIGDRACYVTKGEEDITQDVIQAFYNRPNNVPFLPMTDEDHLHFAINAILDFFRDIHAEDIFKDQYNILLKPSNMGTGSRIRLTAVQGLPFLVFENSPIVQIPLGQQESANVFKNAPLLELVMAADSINMIDYRDGRDLGDNSPSRISRGLLERWYSKMGLGEQVLLEHIREGLNGGWLSKKVLDSSDEEYAYELTNQEFSWHLGLNEGDEVA